MELKMKKKKYQSKLGKEIIIYLSSLYVTDQNIYILYARDIWIQWTTLHNSWDNWTL